MHKREEAIGKVKVSKGSEKELTAVTSEPISNLTKKGEKIGKLQKELTMNKKLKAPSNKGKEIEKNTKKQIYI
ncbi:hypothetical protein ACEF17_12890 [Streptococcus hyovaginalis]